MSPDKSWGLQKLIFWAERRSLRCKWRRKMGLGDKSWPLTLRITWPDNHIPFWSAFYWIVLPYFHRIMSQFSPYLPFSLMFLPSISKHCVLCKRLPKHLLWSCSNVSLLNFIKIGIKSCLNVTSFHGNKDPWGTWYIMMKKSRRIEEANSAGSEPSTSSSRGKCSTTFLQLLSQTRIGYHLITPTFATCLKHLEELSNRRTKDEWMNAAWMLISLGNTTIKC